MITMQTIVSAFGQNIHRIYGHDTFAILWV